MRCVFQVAFKIQFGTAESVFGQLAGAFDDRDQFFHGFDNVNANPAAAFGRFDHQWEP